MAGIDDILSKFKEGTTIKFLSGPSLLGITPTEVYARYVSHDPEKKTMTYRAVHINTVFICEPRIDDPKTVRYDNIQDLREPCSDFTGPR